MRPKKLDKWTSLAFVAAAAVSVCWQPVRAQETHKIGVMLDVTGGASFLGKPEYNAVQLAVEDANQAGGVCDRKFEVVFEDAKSTETDTLLAARAPGQRCARER